MSWSLIMKNKDLKLSEIKSICQANNGDCSKCELADEEMQILKPLFNYGPCGILTMALIKPKYWADAPGENFLKEKE